MEILIVALWLIYDLFYGFHSAQLGLARANEDDRSELECKLWCENTPLAAAAWSFALLTRLNGVSFLLFAGYKVGWVKAAILFIAGLASSRLLGWIYRIAVARVVKGSRGDYYVFGITIPGLLGFVVMPVTGTWLWIAICQA
jgi:hypothetical protein